ncbi:hypothetical protein M8J77_011581 [Diaphorina citri]|nr:hypothetical protein M8J77_011581 [Diaphorina citri]
MAQSSKWCSLVFLSYVCLCYGENCGLDEHDKNVICNHADKVNCFCPSAGPADDGCTKIAEAVQGSNPSCAANLCKFTKNGKPAFVSSKDQLPGSEIYKQCHKHVAIISEPTGGSDNPGTRSGGPGGSSPQGTSPAPETSSGPRGSEPKGSSPAPGGYKPKGSAPQGSSPAPETSSAPGGSEPKGTSPAPGGSVPKGSSGPGGSAAPGGDATTTCAPGSK